MIRQQGSVVVAVATLICHLFFSDFPHMTMPSLPCDGEAGGLYCSWQSTICDPLKARHFVST